MDISGSYLKLDRPARVLVLADMHVCDAYGLLPNDWVSSSGNTIGQNHAQEYLGKCWAHFVSVLPPFDVLLLNGDIVTGNNKFDAGIDLSEIDESFQARAAIKLLEPVVEKLVPWNGGRKRIYMTRGSKYHVGIAGRNEEGIGNNFGVIQAANGRSCHYHLRTAVNGRVLDVGHRQSYMMRYRSSALEREIEFAIDRATRNHETAPQIIIRSHIHVGVRVWDEGEYVAISTPCWKLQDEFALTSITPNRMAPDHLGAVMIEIYPNPEYGRYWDIRKFLYETPKHEVY